MAQPQSPHSMASAVEAEAQVVDAVRDSAVFGAAVGCGGAPVGEAPGAAGRCFWWRIRGCDHAVQQPEYLLREPTRVLPPGLGVRGVDEGASVEPATEICDRDEERRGSVPVDSTVEPREPFVNDRVVEELPAEDHLVQFLLEVVVVDCGDDLARRCEGATEEIDVTHVARIVALASQGFDEPDQDRRALATADRWSGWRRWRRRAHTAAASTRWAIATSSIRCRTRRSRRIA